MKSAALLVLLALDALAQPSFTDVTDSTGLRFSDQKFAGLAMVDVNGDGCPDVLFNAQSRPDGGGNSRLYTSSCGAAPTFQNVTSTQIPSFLEFALARSVVTGDLNGDGLPDIVRNDIDEIQVHFSGGPTPGSFPTSQLVLSGNAYSRDAGMNTEGLALLDADGDGDLDLVFQNSGIELHLNDGTGQFTASATAGLPSLTVDFGGEYLSVADVDDDGDVDMLVRMNQAPDLWLNVGGGKFAPGLGFEPNNNNKGDSVFCDFDSDGDLDFFLSDQSDLGENAVWLQQGTGAFAPGPRLIGDQAVGTSACGDVDNDGWPDLLLGIERLPDGGGLPLGDVLLINQRDGGFQRADAGAFGPGEARGVVLGDYDLDGDLDVLISERFSSQLWRNGVDDGRSLSVRAVVGSREALGATGLLESCDGDRISGLREVSGGTGKGTQPPTVMHFGLPAPIDLEDPVVVRVRFPGGSIVRKAVVPSAMRRVTVRSNEASDLSACPPPGGAAVLKATCGLPFSAFPVQSFVGEATLLPRSGEVPEGLSFDRATGVLSWRPTSAQTGHHFFTVTAQTMNGTASIPFDIEVECPASELSVGCGCDQGGFGWFGAALVLLLARARRLRLPSEVP